MPKNHRASRQRKKRDYDPAWVYLACGAFCLAGAVLYATLGDHVAKSGVSARGLNYIKTPFDIYLFTIGGGVFLIAVGIWKLTRSENRDKRE